MHIPYVKVVAPFHLATEPGEGSKAVLREAGSFYLSCVQVSAPLSAVAGWWALS